MEMDGFLMKEYHIINPAAGHGTALDAAKKQASPDAILYMTTGVGDARRYLAKTAVTERLEKRFPVLWMPVPPIMRF